MKRTALLLLTALYLLSAVGIGVNRFYCCGKLAAVNIAFASSNDQHKVLKKDNCCKNEKQSFKIKDNHFSEAGFSLAQPFPVILPAAYSDDHAITSTIRIQHSSYLGKAPPGKPEVPIYILNCTYRI